MYTGGRKPGAVDLVPRKLRPAVPIEDRFWKHVDKAGDCWLWVGAVNKKGYGLASLRIGRNLWRQRLAHRVSAKLAGMTIDGMEVCHRCDRPRCVRPDHLFIGTQTENVADMDAKGRRGSLHGSDHGQSKLNEDAVLAIRRRRESGERGIDLAREYGVSPSAIVSVIKGRNWKHLLAAR